MSTSDQYETPLSVFKNLDREFGFGLDVCAQHSTAKCPEYWTEEDDALSKDWATDAGLVFGKWLWCNPPYSDINPWITKAIDAQSKGVGTVMLVMADTSVKWFSRGQLYASETRFITDGRLSFLRDGKPASGNNKGSLIFVFDPHRVGWGQVQFVSRASLTNEKV